MAKRGRPRKVEVRRRLYFDGIELIPVDTTIWPWSLSPDKFADSWHLPGKQIAKTKHLVKRAKRLGVTILLQESAGAFSRAVSLI